MSKVIVSGSIAYDRIMDYPGLFADNFVADKAHSINLSFQVDRLSVEFGGTAGNVAYNLALLGEQPEIIATVGADFSQYRSHLLLAGIDPRTIREIEGRAIGIISPGCIADMMAMPPYFRRQGLRYLYDPGQAIAALTPEALKDGMNGAQVLFASDYELGIIMQKTGLSQEHILQLAPTIVVTFGGERSNIISRDGQLKVAATPAKSLLDPTGAGDAYRAGFIKGMFWGLSVQSCGQLASCVAAYAVETYGTQTHKFTLAELSERYASVYGEKLPV